MRVLFAGTPDIAVPALGRVHATHEVCGVLTAPARAVGRGRRLEEPPVAVRARELGLQVLQPARLGGEARAEVAASKPELLAVFAYGRIFGPRFLALFPSGGVNVHPSLLPLYRGPSPIQAALLAGDRQTGVTVQRLALEMDTGGILVQEPVAVGPTETADVLSERLARLGADLLARAITGLEDGTAAETPQEDEQATYCRLVRKEDGRVDWRRSAREIFNAWRAYQPWPGLFTRMNGQQLNLLECLPLDLDCGGEPGEVCGVDKRAGLLIQTGSGLLAVSRLQLQTRKAMDHEAFYNGHRQIVGTVLADDEE